MVKAFFTYLFSFIFFLNQVSYSATIRTKSNVDRYLLNCDSAQEFKKYYECFYDNIKINNSSVLKNEKLKKKDRELQNLLELAQLINVAIDSEFITSKSATQEWLKILDSKYSKKIKKKKLKESINESKCLNEDQFEYFINCFYGDFRNLSVYKNSDLLTKNRIETLMLNSMHLKNDIGDGFVVTLDKNDLYESTFAGDDDGFIFFLMTMDGLGSDFYKKKDLDIDYKKVLMFIAIVVIISLVAKGVLSKSGGNTGSYSSGTTSATAKTSSSSLRYTYSYAPTSSIVQRPWFKYVYRLGGF